MLGENVANPPEARTEGRKLFEPDGTAHVVSGCEARVKGQFEFWVQNNALKAISQVEAAGDLDRADRLMSAYMGDQGAGQYTWDGKHVRAARFTSLPGIRHLLYLLMVRCDPKITEDKVNDLLSKHPKQCGELIRWALGNSQAPVEAGASNGTVKQNNDVVRQEVARQRIVKSPETLD